MGAIQDLPQDIDRRLGLDGNTGEHAVVVYVTNEFGRARLELGRACRAVGGGGVRRLVVEAVQIAARILELLDPLLWL